MLAWAQHAPSDGATALIFALVGAGFTAIAVEWWWQRGGHRDRRR